MPVTILEKFSSKYLLTKVYENFQCIHSIRGTLSTILVVASSGGALLGFSAGNLLPYEFGPWLSLIFPILFLITYAFMPETPYFLMKSDRMEVCLLLIVY